MSWMGYRATFEERFAPFQDELWFGPLVDAYERAQDHDDEGSIANIQDKLIELAKQRGIVLPPARCGTCDKPRRALVHCGDLCDVCKLRHERNRRRERRERVRHARWLAALSPRDRAEYHDQMSHLWDGLFQRDVQ